MTNLVTATVVSALILYAIIVLAAQHLYNRTARRRAPKIIIEPPSHVRILSGADEPTVLYDQDAPDDEEAVS